MAEPVTAALTDLPCASIPFHPLEEDQDDVAGELGSRASLDNVNKLYETSLHLRLVAESLVGDLGKTTSLLLCYMYQPQARRTSYR